MSREQNTVVAKNLPLSWTVDAVKGVFTPLFGAVADVTFAASKKSKTPKTTKTAFVTFEAESGAAKAVQSPEVDFDDEESQTNGKFTISAYVQRPPRAQRAAKAPRATKAAEPKAVATKKTRAKRPVVGSNAFAVVAKGFHSTLTKDDIKKTFANFGTVSEVVLRKRAAFVVFATKEDVEKCLATPAFDLEFGDVACHVQIAKFEVREAPAAKKTTTKRAAKKTTTKRAAKKQKRQEPANTIVIRGIPVALTEDDVKTAVSTIGAVEALRFVGVREKNQFKVGYAVMATPEAVAAALTAATVAANDAQLSLVAYSSERPTDLRVVVTRIPLSYTTEQIEALAKQFGAAEVTLFQPRVVDGEEPPVRSAQTALFKYTTPDEAKAALAKKALEYKTEAGEDATMPMRGYRFRRFRRAQTAQ